MISVLTSGVNSFTLRADCLDEGGIERSSVALHDTGWSVDLIFNEGRGRERREGLRRWEVAGVIREFMVSWHVARESMDLDELNRYMDHIERNVQ